MASPNHIILQGFEWHTPSGPSKSHYSRLTRLLPSLSNLGVTSIWLPPGCKANNPQGNGYDIYDLWDLGEFEQKCSRSTKWGSKGELFELLRMARDMGVEMIWDAVLNHKAGADGTEEVWAVEVEKDDRRYEICPPKLIEAWLRFDFHEREHDGELKYSSFRWNQEHFNGVDWDQRQQRNAIYKLVDDPASAPAFKPSKRPLLDRARSSNSFFRAMLPAAGPSSSTSRQPPRRPGKGWSEDVDDDHGNNDYLMFTNIDHSHKQVREHLINWSRWMIYDIGVDGFRLDAAQHISYSFMRTWIEDVQRTSMQRWQKPAFVVGEVWTGDVKRITDWLDAVQTSSGPLVRAFDSALVYNFSNLEEGVRNSSVWNRTLNSTAPPSNNDKGDLRTLLAGSLMAARPNAAVTLVTNHDTQIGQTLYTPIYEKLLWYAFILLRQEGTPCVFWGDLFGTQGPQSESPVSDHGRRDSPLGDLMMCRHLFAYGEQTDYWHSRQTIGWTRAGTSDRPGCAVLMKLGNPKLFSRVRMAIGQPGEAWVEVLGHKYGDRGRVTIGENGFGEFTVHDEEVNVWVKEDTLERLRVEVKMNINVL